MHGSDAEHNEDAASQPAKYARNPFQAASVPPLEWKKY